MEEVAEAPQQETASGNPPESALSINDFAAKIKEKYPQYKDVDNTTLAKKIVEKYPEYSSKVKFDSQPAGEKPEDVYKVTATDNVQKEGKQPPKALGAWADILSAPAKAFHDNIKEGAKEVKEGVTHMASVNPIENLTGSLQAVEGAAKGLMGLAQATPAMAAFTAGNEAVSKAVESVPQEYIDIANASRGTLINPKEAVSFISAPTRTSLEMVAPELLKNPAIEAASGIVDTALPIAIGVVATKSPKLAEKMKSGEPMEAQDVHEAKGIVSNATPTEQANVARQIVVDHLDPDIADIKDKEIKLSQDAVSASNVVGADAAHAMFAPEIQKAQEDFSKQSQNLSNRVKLEQAKEAVTNEEGKAVIDQHLKTVNEEINKLNPKSDAVQKPSTESVDVRQSPADGKTVGEGNPEKSEPPKAQEEKMIPADTPLKEGVYTDDMSDKDLKGLREEMDKNGMKNVAPIIVEEGTNKILDGNKRNLVADAAGVEEKKIQYVPEGTTIEDAQRINSENEKKLQASSEAPKEEIKSKTDVEDEKAHEGQEKENEVKTSTPFDNAPPDHAKISSAEEAHTFAKANGFTSANHLLNALNKREGTDYKMIQDVPTKEMSEFLSGKKSEVKAATTGKEIEPHKEVKANKTLAIKEIIPNYGLKEMEGGVLHQLKDLAPHDMYNALEDEKTMKGAIGKKLEEKGFVDIDWTSGEAKLTDKGQQFIKAVDSRLETRKGVKAGTDLFPEDANIPEFKAIKQELKTKTDEGTIAKFEQRTADEVEKSEPTVADIERKAESENEAELKEAVKQADELLTPKGVEGGVPKGAEKKYYHFNADIGKFEESENSTAYSNRHGLDLFKTKEADGTYTINDTHTGVMVSEGKDLAEAQQNLDNKIEKNGIDKFKEKIADLAKKTGESPRVKAINQIAKGVEGIVNKLKIKKNLLPEEKTKLYDDLKGILEGTLKLGELSIKEAVKFVVDSVKNSDWYKSFSEEDKSDTDAVLNTLKSEYEDGEKGSNPFEELKDTWIGNIDVSHFKANVEAANLQKEIQSTVPRIKGESARKWEQKWKDVDQAIHIYLDLKRNPEHLGEYYDKLTPEQKKIADLSQNLTDKQKAIAEKISEQYKKVSDQAKDAGVIRNVLDNYVARAWDIEGKMGTEVNRKFGTSTKHSLQRSLDTILEGQAKGMDLKVKGATNNLATLKQEIANVVENRNLINEGSKTEINDEGDKLFTTSPQEGYERIDHPLFKKWGFAGKLEGEQTEAQIIGKRKDIVVSEDGTILQKQDVYAPKAVAKEINNIIGTSKLKGMAFFDTARRVNAKIKQTILTTSLFHHIAFLRNKFLSGSFNKFGDLNPNEARKQGLEAIRNTNHHLEMLVRNGLTIGKIADWDEAASNEKGFVTKKLDQMGIATKFRDRISEMAYNQKRFLFENFGAGLKAFDAIQRYQAEMIKRPDSDPTQVAKEVAELTNNNYGGLNLKRLGRNPTTQDIMHFLLLAPDWTESNLRMAAHAFKRGEEGDLNRRMWAKVFLRGATAISLANLSMSLLPDPNDKSKNPLINMKDRYKRAWDEGHLDWMKVNLSPLAHYFGAPTNKDYYFSLFGHYSDPVRLASSMFDPKGGSGLRFFVNKGSVITKFSGDALTSQDWKGDTYTSADELLGLDDKGLYKRHVKAKEGKKGHNVGEEKGGQLEGKFTKFNIGGAHPVNIQQVPSFGLDQIRGMMPTQIQNMWEWGTGEQSGFQMITNSIGLGITTGTERKKKEEGSVSSSSQGGATPSTTHTKEVHIKNVKTTPSRVMQLRQANPINR